MAWRSARRPVKYGYAQAPTGSWTLRHISRRSRSINNHGPSGAARTIRPSRAGGRRSPLGRLPGPFLRGLRTGHIFNREARVSQWFLNARRFSGRSSARVSVPSQARGGGYPTVGPTNEAFEIPGRRSVARGLFLVRLAVEYGSERIADALEGHVGRRRGRRRGRRAI